MLYARDLRENRFQRHLYQTCLAIVSMIVHRFPIRAWTLLVHSTSRTSQGKNASKCYCCLFTCASTRALHLELTRDLSASSFLEAFRRFTARRGLPSKLQSDNAKTFKGSSVSVKKIMQSTEVKNHLANKQVNWDFIVEKAPWWGGYWERLV